MTGLSERTAVELDLSSRLEVLETVQAVLSQLSAAAGAADDDVHQVNLAVRESVVNAIKHGSGMDAAKRVRVGITLRERELSVRVCDEGPGFDPDRLPDPLAQENLLNVTGRGLLFMHTFMDEVSYTFPPDGGTIVTMVKRFS